MLIQNGLLTYPIGNMTSFSLWILFFFFIPVQRGWIWFPVICLNDYTLKCSATMITSSAQGIRNCNDCHSEVDSFRIFLNMSLYGQNMVSESLQEHQSQKRRFTQRTINGPIYPVFFGTSLCHSAYFHCLMGLTFPITHLEALLFRNQQLWRANSNWYSTSP